MAKRRIEFLSSGFRSVLNSSGMEACVQSVARKQAQEKEQETGAAYVVERMANATSRVVYTAKPSDEDDGRVKGLDHETWMNEVWPRVGGDQWRPRA